MTIVDFLNLIVDADEIVMVGDPEEIALVAVRHGAGVHHIGVAFGELAGVDFYTDYPADNLARWQVRDRIRLGAAESLSEEDEA